MHPYREDRFDGRFYYNTGLLISSKKCRNQVFVAGYLGIFERKSYGGAKAERF